MLQTVQEANWGIYEPLLTLQGNIIYIYKDYPDHFTFIC